MACVDNTFQPHLHDPISLCRDSIQRMSNTSSIIRTAQEVKLINFRIYESQPPTKPMSSPKQHHHNTSTFIKRCSRLATGRRLSIPSTSQAQNIPTNIQWVQRLPTSTTHYETFLESALEEAVGQLVCGPHAAAEEFELGYNYDTLEDADAEAWVRVQAQRVESLGRTWIVASIVEKGDEGRVFAFGRWVLVRTRG